MRNYGCDGEHGTPGELVIQVDYGSAACAGFMEWAVGDGWIHLVQFDEHWPTFQYGSGLNE
jgi:hypothetical protein